MVCISTDPFYEDIFNRMTTLEDLIKLFKIELKLKLSHFNKNHTMLNIFI